MLRRLIILLLIVGVFAHEEMGELEKEMLYKQNDRSPLLAGLCALTPTMGHLYVGKWKRINPFSALVISPAISIILLMPNKTLKKERTIISNTLAENLEPDVAAKFLSYPIPKAIVEEWEKVK